MEVKPGYKQTEVGVIPEDWNVHTLRSCLSAQPDYGINAPAVPFSDKLPSYIRITDITEDGRFSPERPVSVRRADADSYYLHDGDMVFARTGASVGKSYLYKPEDGRLVFAGFLIRVSPDAAKLVAAYLAGYVTTGPYWNWVRLMSMRSGQPGINGKEYGQLPIPLPPTIDEQRAIAGALSDVDGLIGALDQLIAKKRDLKQAAMQQLLTGQKRLPGFHSEWVVKELGKVAEVDVESLGSSTSPDYEFNYISLEDVDAGVLRSSSVQVFGAAPSRARRILRKGDILISTVRPNLKSHLLFTIDAPHWVCSTGFAVVRCREGVTHPGYVFSHLFGYSVSQQIDALLTGSNYPAINSGDVRALGIPVPEYAEQTAIAEVLSDMDAELAALEQRRDKTRALKQGMMQELLTGRTRLV
jgi:type I restriction enzyme S subunit